MTSNHSEDTGEKAEPERHGESASETARIAKRGRKAGKRDRREIFEGFRRDDYSIGRFDRKLGSRHGVKAYDRTELERRGGGEAESHGIASQSFSRMSFSDAKGGREERIFCCQIKNSFRVPCFFALFRDE